MFNLKTHYSLKLLGFLSVRYDGKLFTIDELADQTGIPRSFLGKIVQSLGKQGYLRTKKGPNGGVTLNKSPAEIPIADLLEDLGELQPIANDNNTCCSMKAIDDCVMDSLISDFVTDVLDDRTLEDLSQELADKSS